MGDPKVSIGMPVYNGANYLRRSIQCLLHQDYADLEIVICDNGSTDDTESICREFAKKDERVNSSSGRHMTTNVTRQ
jgi:glycosyltransferase involved in cell wall biosynthesis